MNNSSCLIRMSLESVQVIYENLGLVLADKLNFVRQLKNEMLEAVNHIDEFDMIDEKYLKIINKALENNIDEKDYNIFLYWQTNTYINSEPAYKQWDYWKTIIEELLSDNGENNNDDILTNPISELVSIKRALYDEVTSNYITEIIENDLSDWDRMIIQKFKLDINDDVKDPFVHVEFTYSMCQFQRFWNKLVNGETAESLEKLYNYALPKMRQFAFKDQNYAFFSEEKAHVVTIEAYEPDTLIHPSKLFYELNQKV